MKRAPSNDKSSTKRRRLDPNLDLFKALQDNANENVPEPEEVADVTPVVQNSEESEIAVAINDTY